MCVIFTAGFHTVLCLLILEIQSSYKKKGICRKNKWVTVSGEQQPFISKPAPFSFTELRNIYA